MNKFFYNFIPDPAIGGKCSVYEYLKSAIWENKYEFASALGPFW